MIEASDITQEMKDDFVRMLYDGFNPAVAAEALGTTGTQFRRLYNNPAAHNHDPVFAKRVRDAAVSEAAERGRLERIRDMAWKRAEAGDAKMIEKFALIYDPDWRELRHQNLNVNVSMIARVLPHISTAELERALAEMEAEKGTIDAPAAVRALPAA